jgi:hypothetical protein
LAWGVDGQQRKIYFSQDYYGSKSEQENFWRLRQRWVVDVSVFLLQCVILRQAAEEDSVQIGF